MDSPRSGTRADGAGRAAALDDGAATQAPMGMSEGIAQSCDATGVAAASRVVEAAAGAGLGSDDGSTGGHGSNDVDIELDADADIIVAARSRASSGQRVSDGLEDSEVIGSSAVSVGFTTDADSDSDGGSDLGSMTSGVGVSGRAAHVDDATGSTTNMANMGSHDHMMGHGAGNVQGTQAVKTGGAVSALPDSAFTRFVPREGQNVTRGSGESQNDDTSVVLALEASDQLCFVGSVRVRALAGAVRLLGYKLTAAGSAPSEFVTVQAPAWDTAMVIQATWPGVTPRPCAVGAHASSRTLGTSSAVALIELQPASEHAQTWLDQYNLAPSPAEALLNSLASVPGMHLLLEADASCDSGIPSPGTGAGAAAAGQPGALAGAGARDATGAGQARNAEARRAAKRKARSAAGGSYTCLRRALAISKRWESVARAVVTSHTEQSGSAGVATTVVCGAKGVGKSTFVRFLVNSLLSPPPNGDGSDRDSRGSGAAAVAVLDLDLGQPELGPPGLLSLHVVRSPLLTPPHAHMQQHHSAFYFGDVSPKNDPMLYARAVTELVRRFRVELAVGGSSHDAGLPLVVNTHGWVRGIGLDLLHSTLQAVAPHHIVKIQGRAPSHVFDVETPHVAWCAQPHATERMPHSHVMSPWSEGGDDADAAPDEAARSHAGQGMHERVSSPTPRYGSTRAAAEHGSQSAGRAPVRSVEPLRRAIRTAVDLRTLRLCKYFLPNWHDDGASTRSAVFGERSVAFAVRSMPLFRVPWRCVALRVMHCEVPPSQMLHAFNAAIVGLGVVDAPATPLAQAVGAMRAAVAGASDAGWASIADASVPFADCPRFLVDTPLCDCVGLGIVVGIDPETRMFHVATPVAPTTLASVNVLLRGPLSLPAMFLHQGDVVQDCYVTELCLTGFGTGGTRMHSRNTLKRQRLQR